METTFWLVIRAKVCYRRISVLIASYLLIGIWGSSLNYDAISAESVIQISLSVFVGFSLFVESARSGFYSYAALRNSSVTSIMRNHSQLFILGLLNLSALLLVALLLHINIEASFKDLMAKISLGFTGGFFTALINKKQN